MNVLWERTEAIKTPTYSNLSLCWAKNVLEPCWYFHNWDGLYWSPPKVEIALMRGTIDNTAVKRVGWWLCEPFVHNCLCSASVKLLRAACRILYILMILRQPSFTWPSVLHLPHLPRLHKKKQTFGDRFVRQIVDESSQCPAGWQDTSVVRVAGWRFHAGPAVSLPCLYYGLNKWQTMSRWLLRGVVLH